MCVCVFVHRGVGGRTEEGTSRCVTAVFQPPSTLSSLLGGLLPLGMLSVDDPIWSALTTADTVCGLDELDALTDGTDSSSYSGVLDTGSSTILATPLGAEEIMSIGVADVIRGLDEVTNASRLALEASATAARCWIRVLWLVLQPLGHLAVLSWPWVRAALICAARRAAAQPPKAIALELLALAVLIALCRFLRFVRRRCYVSRVRAACARQYARLNAGVRRRLQLVAMALPHLCFAFACVLCSRALTRFGLREQALALVHEVEPWLSTVVPALRTLRTLTGPAHDHQRLWLLQYWVVWASVRLCIDLLKTIPLVPTLMYSLLALVGSRVSMLEELPFCGYLWLQLPSRRGLDLAYGFVAPQLRRLTRLTGPNLPAMPTRVRAAFQMAAAALGGFQAFDALSCAANEVGLLLVGIFFVLTPTPVASVGLTLLSLGAPLIRSVSSLAELLPAAGADGGARASGQVSRRNDATMQQGTLKVAAPTVGIKDAQVLATHLWYWLKYLMLCFALHSFHPFLRWVPFMTHVQILVVLWFQLPIVQAATHLLTSLLWPLLQARLRARAPAAGEADQGKQAMHHLRAPTLDFSCIHSCLHTIIISATTCVRR